VTPSAKFRGPKSNLNGSLPALEIKMNHEVLNRLAIGAVLAATSTIYFCALQPSHAIIEPRGFASFFSGRFG